MKADSVAVLGRGLGWDVDWGGVFYLVFSNRLAILHNWSDYITLWLPETCGVIRPWLGIQHWVCCHCYGMDMDLKLMEYVAVLGSLALRFQLPIRSRRYSLIIVMWPSVMIDIPQYWEPGLRQTDCVWFGSNDRVENSTETSRDRYGRCRLFSARSNWLTRHGLVHTVTCPFETH